MVAVPVVQAAVKKNEIVTPSKESSSLIWLSHLKLLIKTKKRSAVMAVGIELI